ncbi:hypothetical protein ACPA1H_17740 [Ectopseudomonas chengduensis]
MNTENIELLLEKLININEAILDKLDDVKYEVSTIKDELDWIKEHSYAKVVYDGIHEISSKLDTIEMGISSIDANTANM